MNILSKIGEMFMAIKDLIQPRKGIYYFVIAHKIDDTKPIHLRKKSILKSIKSNNNDEIDLERRACDNGSNKKN